jgi:hypothetical protein
MHQSGPQMPEKGVIWGKVLFSFFRTGRVEPGRAKPGRVEGERDGGGQAGSVDLTNILQGWGQLRANDSRWPIFDGKFVNYPRFKMEWRAYRETYHSVVNDDLAGKTLREKCVKGALGRWWAIWKI